MRRRYSPSKSPVSSDDNNCEYLNIVCRLVHLDKLRLATRREESDVLDAAGGKDPDIIVKNASESKGGVIEKFIKV